MTGPTNTLYEKGVVYNFTVDTVPYFVQDSGDMKGCILPPPEEYAGAFQALIKSNESIRFAIRVSGTDFSGFTKNTYNLKTFYRSAIKEGATACQKT